MADFKGEQLEKNLQTREVYYYHDQALKIKQVSREVYKNKDEVIHYPRGFEGGPKYASIQRFIFKGFKGKLPVRFCSKQVFNINGGQSTTCGFNYFKMKIYKYTQQEQYQPV